MHVLRFQVSKYNLNITASKTLSVKTCFWEGYFSESLFSMFHWKNEFALKILQLKFLFCMHIFPHCNSLSIFINVLWKKEKDTGNTFISDSTPWQGIHIRESSKHIVRYETTVRHILFCFSPFSVVPRYYYNSLKCIIHTFSLRNRGIILENISAWFPHHCSLPQGETVRCIHPCTLSDNCYSS